MIADILDFAPAALLADVRTTTDVIGKPPINALIYYQFCALSSILVSVYLFEHPFYQKLQYIIMFR
jgi:hypothetical protein